VHTQHTAARYRMAGGFRMEEGEVLCGSEAVSRLPGCLQVVSPCLLAQNEGFVTSLVLFFNLWQSNDRFLHASGEFCVSHAGRLLSSWSGRLHTQDGEDGPVLLSHASLSLRGASGCPGHGTTHGASWLPPSAPAGRRASLLFRLTVSVWAGGRWVPGHNTARGVPDGTGGPRRSC
jgi:hypothetical protein